MRQTVWIRYRRADGSTMTEGGRWIPAQRTPPSFERTGMGVHEVLSRQAEQYPDGRPTRLVGVDAMIWRLEA